MPTSMIRTAQGLQQLSPSSLWNYPARASTQAHRRWVDGFALCIRRTVSSSSSRTTCWPSTTSIPAERVRRAVGAGGEHGTVSETDGLVAVPSAHRDADGDAAGRAARCATVSHGPVADGISRPGPRGPLQRRPPRSRSITKAHDPHHQQPYRHRRRRPRQHTAPPAVGSRERTWWSAVCGGHGRQRPKL